MQDMKLFKNLTVQVITAVIIGVIVGLVWPDVGKEMKPLGDTFINAVKMVIAPIIFFTIVLGIAKMGDMKKVGKVGGKAFIYFEVVTTLALIIGLFVVNIMKPGAGLDYSKLEKEMYHNTRKMAVRESTGLNLSHILFRPTWLMPSQKGTFCRSYSFLFFSESVLRH